MTEEQSSRPPIFGDDRIGRWTLGSTVTAHWWPHQVANEATNPDRKESTGEGEVVRIHAGGPEGWIVTLDFGPVQNQLRPTLFNPSQLLAWAD